MKTLSFLIALALAGTAISRPGFADDCNPNPLLVIEPRTGNQNSGQVMFSYGSYVEKYSMFAHKFVWCIEANERNQNVAEFRWGDARNEKKYLGTLVLPGQPASNSTSDASKRMVGERTIKFRRKNRSEWEAIKADTISSARFGSLAGASHLLLTQFTSPQQPAVPGLDEYRDEEGLIDLRKLSLANKPLFNAVLRNQQQIISGASFTVTLPTSQRVADLIQKNQYGKYEKDDFIETRAVFQSRLIYNDGQPQLLYTFGFRPDNPDQFKRLSSLLDIGQVRYKISASEPFIRSKIFVSKESRTVPPTAVKEQIIANVSLGERSILVSPAQLDIMFGNNDPVSTAVSSLFVPE